MSTSMLDEVQVPVRPQPFFICPCCKFSFTEKEKFFLHCGAMKDLIDAAVRKVKNGK